MTSRIILEKYNRNVEKLVSEKGLFDLISPNYLINFPYGKTPVKNALL